MQTEDKNKARYQKKNLDETQHGGKHLKANKIRRCLTWIRATLFIQFTIECFTRKPRNWTLYDKRDTKKTVEQISPHAAMRMTNNYLHGWDKWIHT